MRVEIDNLKTVGTYKDKIKRNRSRIYQMIGEGKLKTVKIDGVIFIKDEDVSRETRNKRGNPVLPDSL